MTTLTFRHFSFALRVTALAGLLGLVLAGTGCSKSTRVTTTAAGHPIRASIQGDHSIDSQPAQGTISSPYGKITIEAARVRFNNAGWTSIPEAVPVEVKISKGTLWLAAGKVTIKQTVR